MLNKLDIINAMLASTGTAPLTSSDTQHPYYIKADNKLNMVNRSHQTHGWWFNTAKLTLRPNTSGEIILPSTTMSVDPVDGSSSLTRRGNKLFDLANNTSQIGRSVDVDIVELVSIEDLPPSAAQYITAQAIFEFFTDEDGGEPKLSTYARAAQKQWIAFKRDHINNADPNWFRSKSYAGTQRRPFRRLPT